MQSECGSVDSVRCGGDPYSADYFTEYGYFASGRHSNLFNLYAFDSEHTSELKTPTLLLAKSNFKYFFDQTSLIQVETQNLWRVPRDPAVND